MKKTATRSTGETTVIDNPTRIDISLHFTKQQYQKLQKGFIPTVMEQKWLISFGNDWLYFHRSWTGHGIYRAQLVKEADGYSIKSFWAERNNEIHKTENDEDDRQTLTLLIAGYLLGVDVRDIMDHDLIRTEKNLIKTWSTFGAILTTSPEIDDGEPIISVPKKKVLEINYTEKITSALLGLATGDALGVPVEFQSRDYLRKHPIKGMTGFGTHHQPVGTFSDDSSLTFCLAEAIISGFDTKLTGQNFVKWAHENYWTATGSVFDIGNATRESIERIAGGVKAEVAGCCGADENGNGSLMRILPLAFYLLDKPIPERFEITRQVSSITHGHIRSVIACFYYLEFARHLLEGQTKRDAYQNLRVEIPGFMETISINPREVSFFDRLLKADISNLSANEISSSGYVIDTLEASIWCLLTTNNYQSAVLKAVNLGSDTDTTAAVTGGIAGLLYGHIPAKWLVELARLDDIKDLGRRMGNIINRL